MDGPYAQLLRGTLHILILSTLAAGRLHGYGIATTLARRSGGELELEDGALYQALHRMEERGWVRSEWGHAETGKRARFYTLTESGRRQLGVEKRSWVRYSEAVMRVLSAAEA
jgi:transcriptional regulator